MALKHWLSSCIAQLEGEDDLRHEDLDVSRRRSPHEIIFDPAFTWVCLVGINSEWPDERATVGDIALFEALADQGIDRDHMIFVKDSDATVENVHTRLAELLSKTSVGDTLIVYYGGHGQPGEFCLVDGPLRHRDLIELIESMFEGTVIFSADCCHSGTFYRALDGLAVPRSRYICLMSTAADQLAGPAWTFTEVWITCLRALLLTDSGLTWKVFVSQLSDAILRIKGDLFGIYCSYDVNPESAFFQGRQNKNRAYLRKPSTLSTVPSTASSLFEAAPAYSLGDAVYYQWKGGYTDNWSSTPYIFPVWFAAVVTEILDGETFRVKVTDPAYRISWEALATADRMQPRDADDFEEEDDDDVSSRKDSEG